MPIRHAVIHHIHKVPDGSPAVINLSADVLPVSQAIEDLVGDFNDAYNAKQGKSWGFFAQESGAHPLSGWLKAFLDGESSFLEFTTSAVEQLNKLLEESALSVGGHVLFCHYQQGMTDYLTIAVLQQETSITIDDSMQLSSSKHLAPSQFHMACRVNLSEWRGNTKSQQYISMIKPKGGRRSTDMFADFLGCQEGVDSPSETRTLLKAFSDFVESEDLPEKDARGKTDTLVNYASSQARLGEPISLEELSSLIDEDRPKAFFDHIRNKDYGLSPEIPADKKTLKQFQKITGRAPGLSISFESHLLGSQIEFIEANDQLVIHKVPQLLKDQLRKAKAGNSKG